RGHQLPWCSPETFVQSDERDRASHHDAYEVRVNHAPDHPIPCDGLLTRCLSGLSVCHGTERDRPTRAPWSAPRCHVIPSFGNEHDPCRRFVSSLSVAMVRPLTSTRSEAHSSTL